MISCSPWRETNIKLPSGAVFLIANSCVEMNKTENFHFNIRETGCLLASKLLAKYKSLQWNKVQQLEKIQGNLEFSLEEMLLITDNAFHPGPDSPEEVFRCLGISHLRLPSFLANGHEAHY